MTSPRVSRKSRRRPSRPCTGCVCVSRTPPQGGLNNCVCVQIQQYLDRNNQRRVERLEPRQLFKLQQSEKVRNSRLPSTLSSVSLPVSSWTLVSVQLVCPPKCPDKRESWELLWFNRDVILFLYLFVLSSSDTNTCSCRTK